MYVLLGVLLQRKTEVEFALSERSINVFISKRFFGASPQSLSVKKLNQLPISHRTQSEQSVAERSGYEEERAATPVCSSTPTVGVRAAYFF